MSVMLMLIHVVHVIQRRLRRGGGHSARWFVHWVDKPGNMPTNNDIISRSNTAIRNATDVQVSGLQLGHVLVPLDPGSGLGADHQRPAGGGELRHHGCYVQERDFNYDGECAWADE